MRQRIIDYTQRKNAEHKLARICGLIAHIAEQRATNRLIHPSSRYVGPAPRRYAPAESRA